MRPLVAYIATLLVCCNGHLRSNAVPAPGQYTTGANSSDMPIGSNAVPLTTTVANTTNITTRSNAVPAPGPYTTGANSSDMPIGSNAVPLTTTVANKTNITTLANSTNATQVRDMTLDTYGNMPEYYGTLVKCAGKVFLLTRLEMKEGADGLWRTRVRELEDSSRSVDELPSAILAHHHMSHNIAGVCVGNKVYLVGGQTIKHNIGKKSFPHDQGVWISETDPSSLSSFVQISKPSFMFRGEELGCHQTGSHFCPWDGRFSLIYFQYRFILYARANIPTRAVQMTASTDLQSWSSFERIKIDDVIDEQSQIYFLVATVIKDENNGEHIAGHIPALLTFSNGGQTSGGLHFTRTEDGLHWTKPTNVYERSGKLSASKEIDRHVMGKSAGLYAIHPVGIFKHRLITQRPTSIAVAFQTSQEYKTLGEMEAHLNLTSIGLRHDLLREAAVSYDLDIWDE